MRLSVVLSAIVAALVGFGGTLALIVAAAEAVGARPAEISSWVTALCLSMAATSTWLSIRHRMPIITAWSTPGAALIAATAGTTTMQTASGAFLLAGALIVLTALFRPIAALIERIPPAIAAAMLAGILLRFAIPIFEHAAQAPGLVLPLLAVFLAVRLVSPPGAVLAALGTGLLLTFWSPAAPGAALAFSFSELTFIRPAFDPGVLIGLGLPLYLVTMASQNLPGLAVLRAADYSPPSRSILTVTGLASLLTAPFGAHTTNLAAITAAICTGPEAHPDPQKRWLAGPVYGAVYVLFAVVGASAVALLAAMPTALVASVAGLALLGPAASALGVALAVPEHRMPATLTLAAAASGMSLAGIGSAFWSLVAGLAALALQAGADALRSRRSVESRSARI